MSKKGARKTILEKISQSKDETLGKGRFFHSKDFLNNLCYSDVMDVVLYYISLQDDLEKISKIETYDFFELAKRLMDGWIEKVEKQWGTVKTPKFYGSKETYDRPRIWEISGAWDSSEEMGPAGNYYYLHPGFGQHKYLLLFFKYPEGLPDGCGNWPVYKKAYIENMIFPKWRREMHQKRLMAVLDLAESICQELRKIEPKKD